MCERASPLCSKTTLYSEFLIVSIPPYSDQYYPAEGSQIPEPLAGYHLTDLVVKEKDPRDRIQEETDEIELFVIPKYLEEEREVNALIESTTQNYDQLVNENEISRRKWHQEVDEIFNRFNLEINGRREDDLTALRTHQYLLRTLVRSMVKTVKKNRKLVNSAQLQDAARYQSKLKEYSDMPSKREIKVPSLITKTTKGKELKAEFGQLKSTLTQTYVEQKTVVKASLLGQQAVVVATVPTRVKNLCKVACVGTHEAWVNGMDQTLTCIDIFGTIQGTVKSTCTLHPTDISMSRRGELVYTNSYNRTVNIVRHGKSETFVEAPEGWQPQGICGSRSGDFLVSMVTADFSRYKIVCYDPQTAEVKREIEKDESETDIFSGGKYQIFLSENINGDICASDRNAKLVIVVDKIGQVRFRYNGKESGIKKTFTPKQIETDSMGQIIVADYKNNCLHILDEGGKFLRLVDNKGLDRPTGVSLDKEGRLWVTLYNNGMVMVIQYKK